jgi:hypothetical protein
MRSELLAEMKTMAIPTPGQRVSFPVVNRRTDATDEEPRRDKRPVILLICGSHQLKSHMPISQHTFPKDEQDRPDHPNNRAGHHPDLQREFLGREVADEDEDDSAADGDGEAV